MFKRMKNMLELTWNIRRKLDGLSRTLNSHYFDKHDKDNAGNPKKKPFMQSSLRIKPLLTTFKLVRTGERVADIYAVIATKQENGIHLLDEPKEKNDHAGIGNHPGRSEGTSSTMCFWLLHIGVQSHGNLILRKEEEGERIPPLKN